MRSSFCTHTLVSYYIRSFPGQGYLANILLVIKLMLLGSVLQSTFMQEVDIHPLHKNQRTEIPVERMTQSIYYKTLLVSILEEKQQVTASSDPMRSTSASMLLSTRCRFVCRCPKPCSLNSRVKVERSLGGISKYA